MVHSVFLFLNIGTPELILILGVALLLFGGNKLPELARGLGKGIREFKDASEGVKREIHNQINSFDESVKNQPESTTVANNTTTSAATPDVSPLDQSEIEIRQPYPSEHQSHSSNSTEIK